MLGTAVEWGDKMSDKAADVARVKEVISFIKTESGILQKFTGDLLEKALT